MDSETIRQGLAFYLVLVSSISIHEWAHAIASDRLGDPTPRSQGRVTLNPLAHLDPIGTVLLPLLMIFIPGGLSLIGWGKPVQINPSYYRHKRRDDILVTMAGPASNLVLAALVAVAGRFCGETWPKLAPLFVQMILLNAGLVVFNLIPIPPLDGSRVFRHIVGMSEEAFMNFARWGFIVLIVLINLPIFRQVMFQAILVVASPFLIVMGL